MAFDTAIDSIQTLLVLEELDVPPSLEELKIFIQNSSSLFKLSVSNIDLQQKKNKCGAKIKPSIGNRYRNGGCKTVAILSALLLRRHQHNEPFAGSPLAACNGTDAAGDFSCLGEADEKSQMEELQNHTSGLCQSLPLNDIPLSHFHSICCLLLVAMCKSPYPRSSVTD
ncbi:Hypothetical predicted protein [Podarcis lilfordi]|uniref:Uncharacterized protein n=1 Tax=Podarcis lilfordi TaxID=74358 RepID=A0AA35KQD4_9SAUR|nr:Hypothetical predicted protein [Podarcis lilfordi]